MWAPTDEVLFRGQVLEDAAALEHLDHAAPDHLVGRQPVDALAGQLDMALGHFARARCGARPTPP